MDVRCPFEHLSRQESGRLQQMFATVEDDQHVQIGNEGEKFVDGGVARERAAD